MRVQNNTKDVFIITEVARNCKDNTMGEVVKLYKKRTEIIKKTVPYSCYCQHGGGTFTRAFKYSKPQTFQNNNPCLSSFCAFHKTLTQQRHQGLSYVNCGVDIKLLDL